MGKFLSDMIGLGVEALFEIPSSKKKIEDVKKRLNRFIIDNEEIDVNDFIEMYDTRIHNFDSKRDDIKFLKQLDFEGVYIIHNCSKNIYLVGKSKKVLRKIDRQFRGFENVNVYSDFQNNDSFKIRIIDFENSNYKDIDRLVKELTDKYGTYTLKKANTQVKEKNIKEEKNNIIAIILCFTTMILVLLFCFIMIYWSTTPKEGEIKITTDAKEYYNKYYEDVKNEFEDMGFNNIKIVPKEDLITGWLNKDGEIEKITINDTTFKKDDIFSEDAEVIITYHSFKDN